MILDAGVGGALLALLVLLLRAAAKEGRKRRVRLFAVLVAVVVLHEADEMRGVVSVMILVAVLADSIGQLARGRRVSGTSGSAGAKELAASYLVSGRGSTG